ncbi:lysophospholipid acyltransferase family protein [Shimia thalassica]|uniref:lysophospholipid acyltransferase family protein n=1 Tax=Shimia thalassica TaxID=1715693 RepID=UPI0026E44387|nr:lysophospholipid acyltransferase family protein [Shimia thalassica]MDO6480908.1 lysophospholipid acyltransferase family protein [Shimia thalassica]
MAQKQTSFGQRAVDYTVNLVIRGAIGLALILPYETRVRGMGWLTSHVLAPIGGFRKRVRSNLAHVMPDLPKTEVERMARAVPDNVGRTLIEIYSGEEFVQRAITAPIEGPGLACLEAARDTGRPVILVTGHMGNYDAVRANLIHRGYNMGALYRRMSNPYFNEHYVRSISKIGTPMFEQGRKGMIEMVRHIKAGGILGILTDLYVQDGEPLDFFGQKARTSLITAELALKFDAALIPVYGLRNPDGLTFRIVAQDEIPHSDPLTMTQAVNDGLETLVRENMDQWFWIHRRWKYATQPLQPKKAPPKSKA